eukprot:Skav202282  [mRNA]  locus=scaffold3044:293451:295031:- [translate_table: standard]
MCSVPPLTSAEVEEALARDKELQPAKRTATRRTRHKFPMMHGHGPQRPWPWMKTMQWTNHSIQPDSAAAPADDQHLAWMRQVLAAADDSDAQTIAQALLTQPYRPWLAQNIVQAHACSLTQPPNASDVAAHIELQDAILMWQVESNHQPYNPCMTVDPAISRISLQQVRFRTLPDSGPVTSAHTKRRQKLEEHWRSFDVVTQLRHVLDKESRRKYSFPSPCSHIPCCTPVYLYVFSGRRRLHDFQHFAEERLKEYGLQGHVVLIDLALSPKHDVGRPELVEQLMQLLRQGVVQGVLLAPPCETWSQARFQKVGDHDPRPLRSSTDPFALPGLTVKELAQVEVANLLLCVAIKLLAVAALTKTPAILEHPALPAKEDRPSIWRLPWLQTLETNGLISRTLIWQAYYGGVAMKPTHLAHCWVPQLTRQLHARKQPVAWDKLLTLRGKDQRGSWFTSRAKEYPALLNDIFATSFVLQQQATATAADASAPLPKDMWAIVDDLTSGHIAVTDQIMRPDYGKLHRQLESLD